MIGLVPFLSAIPNFSKVRKPIEKDLKEMAKSTPLWPWAESINGFGSLNLAAIIAEAGDDICTYRSVGGLWKRFGLAVIEGKRQRKVTDPELAELMGYNPSRRAVAYLLGDCLIKKDNAYVDIYRARKEIELVNPDVKTKKHAHNRAARYMVKCVLRDVYRIAHGNG
jgi:hypothetical protein